jgi:hypothetical protein
MAIYHELVNNTVVEQALGPLTQTGDAAMVGAVIDTRDCQSVAFFIQTGAIATGGATFAVTAQHGDAANLSDAVAVDPACLVGSLAGAGFTGANPNSTRKLGYTPGKGAGRRYVRVTLTPTGNVGAAAVSVVAVKLPLRTP